MAYLLNVNPTMRILLALTLLLAITSVEAQERIIKVKGQVLDASDGQPLNTLMAVDKKSGSGTFGMDEGRFILTIPAGDTLLVGAIGYETISFAIPDSLPSNVMEKIFYLEKLVVDLPEVEIISERDLQEIQREIQELGYDERDYRLSGVDAFSSPVTFLYQMFSRRERSKRRVMELQNEERMRELLRELFKKYVDYDIIQLEDEEFDDFIAYCNISEYFLKNSSQYDFLVFVKKRFKAYKESPAWIRQPAIDDEYYKK